MFAGNTGVLLSATSTPVWAKNPWLGPLFTAGAISNGAAAIRLALEFRAEPRDETAEAPSTKPLEKIDTAAHIAEAGYLSSAGTLAKPLTHGTMAPYFWGAVAGLAVSEILDRLPARKGTRRWTKVAAAVIGVAGGFALKWAMQQAGPISAGDPEADRQISRPAGER